MASDPSLSTEPSSPLRYIDIGINFTDPVFHGIYNGTQRHESDFAAILQRAQDIGCQKFLITGSDLTESQHAIELAKQHPGLCYATVGVHPCSAHQFDTHPGGPSVLLSALKDLATSAKAAGHAVAFGEIGLDYDRLFLTPKAQQLQYFEAQLELAVDLQLPLFLHSRAASEDFERLLRAKLHLLPKRGVVHSFTGTCEEMQRLVDMGFDIGVNGCSMKAPENLPVIQAIPLANLHLETDGPWCELRPSHASAAYLQHPAPELPKAVKKEKFAVGCMVKGRNESVAIARVAWAVAGIRGVDVKVVADAAWRNSVRMFGLGEVAEDEEA